MTNLPRLATIILRASIAVGLVAILIACAGPAPVPTPVAQPTATVEQAQSIAPVPPPSGPAAAPAPAKSAPAIAPAPAVSVPDIAPAPPPGAGSQGTSGIAVGAPAIAAMAPAPAAPMAVNSAGSYAPQVAPAAATNVTHGIVVSGSGQVALAPDQATVTAGVQTRGATAQEAQTLNNRTMNAVLSAIKGLGIPDKDIQTVGIQLYPIYDQGQTVTGYSSSNNVTVLVENIDQAGPVLDAAVAAGANQAGNVTFGLKDETAARNKALALAAADARSKADALAGALGLHINDIQSVTEGSSSGPISTLPRPMAASAAGTAISVEPGQLSVTAQMTIVFSY